MSGDFLSRLNKARNNDEFKRVMRKAKPEDVKAVIDLTMRIMRKKIPLSKKYVAIIMKNRHRLRHMVHPKFSIKSKKRFFVKHGGSLTSLLKAGARITGQLLKRTPVKHLDEAAARVVQATAARANTAARQAAAVGKTIPSGSTSSIAMRASKRLSKRVPKMIDKGAGKILMGIDYALTPAKYVVKKSKKYIKEHSDPKRKLMSMGLSTGGDVPKASGMGVMKEGAKASDLELAKFQALGPHMEPVAAGRIKFERLPGLKYFPYTSKDASVAHSSGGRMYEKMTRGHVFKLAEPPLRPQPFLKSQSAANLPALKDNPAGSVQSLFASPEA